MPELREVFEMTTKQIEPDLDAWRKQENRQRRSGRNRKLGALAVAAALGAAAIVVVVRLAGGEDRTRIAVPPSPMPQAVPEVDYVLDLDTGEATPLPASIVGETDEADWYSLSPDGSMLSFVAPGDERGPQIFVANLDGTGIQQVTNDPQGVFDGSWSAWSPDGATIAYEGFSDASTPRNLFIVDVATGASTQVTFSESDVYGTQFSPDGSALVYAGGDKDAGVRLAPIGGGKQTLLAGGGEKKGDAGNGLFSPDGSLLSYAFTETVGAPPGGIWIANADGTDPRQLTNVFLVCSPGAWSPDSTRLACSEFSGSGGVFVIDVATGETTRVADGSSATWLDDHRLIIDL